MSPAAVTLAELGASLVGIIARAIKDGRSVAETKRRLLAELATEATEEAFDAAQRARRPTGGE